MVEEGDNYVYLVEADPKAVARAVRWRWILVLSPIPVLLALVAVMALLGGELPPLWDLLQRLLLLIAILLGMAYFLFSIPCRVRKTDVMIGGDFIHAPLAASPSYTATVKYKDITRVKVSISKGHIEGATIATQGGTVCTGRIKDPGIVVRAVFDRAPETVVWPRSWWPFQTLSRKQIHGRAVSQ